MLARAKSFAEIKHQNQYRKNTNIPYVTHPIAVAEKVMPFTQDIEVIAAAYLHDTLEDTQTTEIELEQLFGPRVAKLVCELTSDKTQIEKMGKAKYIAAKINHMSSHARLIKFCDRWDNVSDLTRTPQEFAKRYAHETEEIIRQLQITPTSTEIQIIAKIREYINPFLAPRPYMHEP